ncbi:MAG: hypothetical protein ACE5GW_07225, partial [Planctomycetota bacterium]
ERIRRDAGTYIYQEAEVREWLGADQVLYQDLEALVGAASDGDGAPRRFCAACFSGHYPTGDVTPEVLSAIESERLGNRR